MEDMLLSYLVGDSSSIAFALWSPKQEDAEKIRFMKNNNSTNIVAKLPIETVLHLVWGFLNVMWVDLENPWYVATLSDLNTFDFPLDRLNKNRTEKVAKRREFELIWQDSVTFSGIIKTWSKVGSKPVARESPSFLPFPARLAEYAMGSSWS